MIGILFFADTGTEFIRGMFRMIRCNVKSYMLHWNLS